MKGRVNFLLLGGNSFILGGYSFILGVKNSSVLKFVVDERMILMIVWLCVMIDDVRKGEVGRVMFWCFGGVRDPISGRVAGSDGQTMANLEVRELKKRISEIFNHEP